MLKPMTLPSVALGVGLVAFGCTVPADEVDTTAAGIGEEQQDPQQEQPYSAYE